MESPSGCLLRPLAVANIAGNLIIIGVKGLIFILAFILAL